MTPHFTIQMTPIFVKIRLYIWVHNLWFTIQMGQNFDTQLYTILAVPILKDYYTHGSLYCRLLYTWTLFCWLLYTIHMGPYSVGYYRHGYLFCQVLYTWVSILSISIHMPMGLYFVDYYTHGSLFCILITNWALSCWLLDTWTSIFAFY